MATVTKWDRSVTIQVINALTGEGSSVWLARTGEHVALSREVWNAPVEWIYPELVASGDIVIIDWKPAHQALKDALDLEHAEAKKFKRKLPPFEEELTRRMRARLLLGVDYNGKHYMPWGWGSGAKDKQTLGLTEDVGKRDGVVQYIEGYQRLGRAWLSNGLYGGGVVKIKVKYARAGTIHGGTPIADGVSILFDDIWQQLKGSREPIALGESGQNMQIWQQFEPDRGFRIDMVTSRKLRRQRIKDMPESLAATFGEIGDYKRALIVADEFMLHHPYFSSQLKANAKAALYTMGTTLFVPGVTRLILPSATEEFVVQTEGTNITLVRYPVDAKSNVQAVKLTKNERYYAELERMAKMKAIQSSWTNREMHKKGMDEIVERFTDEYDAVICLDDIKYVAGHDLDQWRKDMDGQVVEIEIFISATQYFGPESLMFAPIKRWKDLGGDFDGDMAMVMIMDMFPNLFAQAWAWRNATSSLKIKKSRTYEFEKWVDFLLNSFNSGVGFASNVAAMSYVEPPSRRHIITAVLAREIPDLFNFAKEENQAKKQGPTVQQLDWVLNRSVKAFTDIFKTFAVNAEDEMQRLRRIQSAISVEYEGTPPWVGWRRSSRAFVSELPKLRSELPEEFVKAAMMKGSTLRSSDEWRIHIGDKMKGGAIAFIYLRMRPYLQRQFNKLAAGGDLELVDALKPALLSDFENWAPTVDEVSLTRARSLVSTFMALNDSTDHSDVHQVERLNENIQSVADVMVREHFDGNRLMASYALWRAAHHSRSNLAGAAAVFCAMPSEALHIVKTKPGIIGGASSYECNVVGADRNFTKLNKVVGPFQGRVVAVELSTSTRLAVVTDERLVDHTGSNLGSDVVGLLPRQDFENALKGESAPPVGRYLITMRLMGGRSYKAHFSPL